MCWNIVCVMDLLSKCQHYNCPERLLSSSNLDHHKVIQCTIVPVMMYYCRSHCHHFVSVPRLIVFKPAILMIYDDTASWDVRNLWTSIMWFAGAFWSPLKWDSKGGSKLRLKRLQTLGHSGAPNGATIWIYMWHLNNTQYEWGWGKFTNVGVILRNYWDHIYNNM